MACIDFMNLVVDDDIALEGNQSFTICVGNSTAMVTIIDDDGEYNIIMYVVILGHFFSCDTFYSSND